MTLLVLALLIATEVHAASPPPDYKLLRSEDSPQHRFVVETYGADGRAAVWLRDSAGHRAQLWARDGSGIDPYVYVSPDERWIVCIQKLYHGASGAWLYEHLGSLAYSEIGPPSFSDAAWSFFRRQTHVSFQQDYRFGISTGGWQPQSHALLVELSGDDSRTLVRRWYCYYDLEKHRFYIDTALQKKNRDAISNKSPNQSMQLTAGICEKQS